MILLIRSDLIKQFTRGLIKARFSVAPAHPLEDSRGHALLVLCNWVYLGRGSFLIKKCLFAQIAFNICILVSYRKVFTFFNLIVILLALLPLTLGGNKFIALTTYVVFLRPVLHSLIGLLKFVGPLLIPPSLRASYWVFACILWEVVVARWNQTSVIMKTLVVINRRTVTMLALCVRWISLSATWARCCNCPRNCLNICHWTHDRLSLDVATLLGHS